MNTLTNVDAFDARLEILNRKGRSEEADAAMAVYERLRTARSIAESLLVNASASDVIALMDAITAESTKMTDASRS